jgi:hypothetical protein
MGTHRVSHLKVFIIESLQASVWLTAEALRAQRKSNEDIIMSKPSVSLCEYFFTVNPEEP